MRKAILQTGQDQAFHTSPGWLFGLALGVYLFIRLYALPNFPIYFFTDEAVQTVSAADLLTNHFSSPDGEVLPTYFQNGSQYNLSASVYLQIIPYWLFGKSIWVTRGTAVLMTLIAAVCVGLILSNIFHSPYPWLAVLILSVTPAWFLHSRTAFETALASSFFAGCLYAYLRYRGGRPRWLMGAVILGALAFYAYSGMRPVILVLAGLLFLSDFAYHRQHWRAVLAAAGLAALLALPFARFLINHPDATTWQLRQLGSYWVSSRPWWEKLAQFALEYIRGLNPVYWYLPNAVDLPRHIMPGYGHLWVVTLPLGLLGLAIAFYRIRDAAYRTLLLAVAAAPAGAALVQVGIPRLLVMVIPMAVLTAIGAEAALAWLQPRLRFTRSAAAGVLFLSLTAANAYMLWDAVFRGPLWFTNYGLNGMQYGAEMVFGEVARTLKADPQTRIILSPAWTNGTDVLARFFFTDPVPFQLAGPDGAFQQVMPLTNTLFVMLPEEYERIPRSRFSAITVEKILRYPDGSPGFYFIRLKYVDQIEQVIAREETERLKPLSKTVAVDGAPVQISYPRLDIGTVDDLFTSDPETLIRTAAINPLRLTLDFPTPRLIRAVNLRVGGMAMEITLQAWAAGAAAPLTLVRSLPDATEMREVRFDYQPGQAVTRLTVVIQNTHDPAEGNVHLWKMSFH